MLKVFFDALKGIDITIADHTEGGTSLTGPTGAANAMHVIFGIIWQLVIHHKIDAQQIQTARGHIGGD